jgi:hypothetical protein
LPGGLSKLKGNKPGFNESDAFNHVNFIRVGPGEFEDLLRRIKMLDVAGTVKPADKAYVSLNPDVSIWQSNVGPGSWNHYLTNLIYFSKCVNLTPSELLNLKASEDPQHRYFPAERLIETWIKMARQKGLPSSVIFNTLNATRSFFLHSRAPLLKIVFVYKPKPKRILNEDILRKFRDGFNFYLKVLFDFLISVPVRDGQFTRCKYCGEELFPRWRHITTFPRIEPYSPFIIKPQKGHDSERYPDGLRQVCFLTKTLASELNALRDLKEAMLQRSLTPDEYIFTHQINQAGILHVTPITRETIGTVFRTNKRKTGEQINPQLLRTWVNSTLASRGIEKQLRDIYLGHTCGYEMGYIMQLLPQWQRTFRRAKALEALDLMASVHRQEKAPKPELALSNQEYELLRSLLRRFKESGAEV